MVEGILHWWENWNWTSEVDGLSLFLEPQGRNQSTKSLEGCRSYHLYVLYIAIGTAEVEFYPQKYKSWVFLSLILFKLCFYVYR